MPIDLERPPSARRPRRVVTVATEPRSRRRWAVGCLAAMLALAGCTPAPPAPGPEPTASSSESATASATPTPDAGPTLDPDGSAADNLPFFTTIVDAVWATPEQVQGRAYIDALVAAGFDKSAMQVTRDQSTVGNAAESIQFSVQWGEDCLIGQVGPATGAPVTVVVPALEPSGCLVGQTRPIDW